MASHTLVLAMRLGSVLRFTLRVAAGAAATIC